MKQHCRKVKLASKALANLATEKKNQLLMKMAEIIGQKSDEILAANAEDLMRAKKRRLSNAMLDRLLLNQSRTESMQQALMQIVDLEDPVGELTASYDVPSGITVQKRRIPLGVILMIYEARPNVAVEAAALCIKSGNAALLRGGSDALQSNKAIARCWQQALKDSQINPYSVHIIENTDRALLEKLFKWEDCIDLVIPRGGENLIRYVVENSHIPVIQHYKGLCHLYVDKSANVEMALKLIIDGKTSRPAVCNSLETILVHASIAPTFLPLAYEALLQHQVEIRGCEKTVALIPQIKKATEEDFATEYLELIVSIKVVDDIQEAIDHIDQYGSHHTEVIVTEDESRAQQFIQLVDAAVVMHNASSRFSDGGELGLGAEIGISTSKLHAYGPMGLKALTTEKFVVRGSGQIRK